MHEDLGHFVTPGQRIRWLREQKKMLQVTLARAIGISSTAVSKLELSKSKRPAAHNLLKIAAILEANPEWIMHGKGKPWMKDTVADTGEMIETFKKLSTDKQAAILAAAKALL